nr:type II secretion system protein GspN [uncultured Dethiosulfovibrio sp.]
MKRITSFLFPSLALIVGLVVGIRVFSPWEDMTELVFLKATSSLPAGMTAEAKGFSVDGFIPAPTVRGLDINVLMGSVRMTSLKITPMLTNSIKNFAPTVYVDIDRATMDMGGSLASFTGGMVVCLRPKVVSVSDVDIKGDLMAQGNMAFSLATSKISQADMVLKTPEEMSGVLSALSAMLPLKRESDGLWKLKRQEER